MQNNFCNLCDISISCEFSPGRGEGVRNQIAIIVPSINNTEYKKGILYNKVRKPLLNIFKTTNIPYFITSLVKCPTNIITDFEIDNCTSKLIDELYEIRPKIIITVGDTVTDKFLNYNSFKHVVNKAKVITLNKESVIIYPIYNPSNKNIDVIKEYSKNLQDIEKMYKQFINGNYVIL